MARFFELFLAFLAGLFGLGRKRVRGPSRKRPKRAGTRPARPPTPAQRPGRGAPTRPAERPTAQPDTQRGHHNQEEE
ncbi:MAG: hypothetical protein ACK4YP_25960, partial [Myxococcota bacterium]